MRSQVCRIVGGPTGLMHALADVHLLNKAMVNQSPRDIPTTWHDTLREIS